MGRQKEILATIEDHLRIRNKLVRQALAECLGTLILVVSRCWGVRALSNPWVSEGKCPGKGAVLLPEFTLGTSPALVQPAARGLEEKSLTAGKKLCGNCFRVSFGVAGKGWVLLSVSGVWGLLPICEAQGAKCCCCISSVLLEIMKTSFLSALKYILGTEILQVLSPGEVKAFSSACFVFLVHPMEKK